jgi:hypothetical protein
MDSHHERWHLNGSFGVAASLQLAPPAGDQTRGDLLYEAASPCNHVQRLYAKRPRFDCNSDVTSQ